MLALIGPNSTSSAAMRLMKRPSEVPPLVDSCGLTPQVLSMAVLIAAVRMPGGVRKGLPDRAQTSSYSRPCRSRMSRVAALSASAVC